MANRELEWVKLGEHTPEFKFKEDDNIYEQVSNQPGKNNLCKIGLIKKGTPINIQTDGRFYIVVEKIN